MNPGKWIGRMLSGWWWLVACVVVAGFVVWVRG